MSERKNHRGPGPHGPGRRMVDKAENPKATWARLIGYCREYIPAIIVALLAAAIGTVLQILGPDKLKIMTNEIMKGLPSLVNGLPIAGKIDFLAFRKTAFLLLGFYATAAFLSLTQNYIMATVTQRVSKNLRSGIGKKINRLPLGYFDKISFGDILSRVTNDVDAIGQSLNQSIGGLVTAVTMLIGAGIMMFYNSWILALTAIAASILGFLAMTLIMKSSQKYFVRQQNDLGAANGHIEEVYGGHTVVKAYNAGRETKRVFAEINNSLYESGWKSQFFSGLMMPLMFFVGNFSYVVVCVVGAALAMKGTISFGVIVAFMLYIRLFTQPLSQIAQALQGLQRAAAAGERVFNFLAEEELADEGHKTEQLANVRGDVEFRRVNFGYNPGVPVIHDFSAKISAGQKVAIVGPTGAGKTTIVNLLMGFYELDGGAIFVDGVPTTRVSRKNVHEQFSVVLQDTWLFAGTIKENIIYCKEGVSDEAVQEACKAVGLHHYINTLPQGYDTVLTDKLTFSAGQRQLINIARAMIQNAPILILDEATSSVDTRTEMLIQRAMDQLTEGRTSFVIAHRLSTIKNADLILVMRNGDIVESGRHQELLNLGGYYAELYNSQFESVA